MIYSLKGQFTEGEDRIEIEDLRGDVMNISLLDFEVLEVSTKEESKYVKSNDIICSKCKECASISIDDDYKISIFSCKNGHKLDSHHPF